MLKRFTQSIMRFADHWWFAPLVGLLAGLDSFVIVVPIEALLLPSVALHPRRWIYSSLCVATGSALGAALLAHFCNVQGAAFILGRFPGIDHTHTWKLAQHLIEAHGAWAIALFALGPLPQHPAAALAGIFKYPTAGVFGAIWMGRALKYGFLTWCVSHARDLKSWRKGKKRK